MHKTYREGFRFILYYSNDIKMLYVSVIGFLKPALFVTPPQSETLSRQNNITYQLKLTGVRERQA